jgi:hypothetical protein
VDITPELKDKLLNHFKEANTIRFAFYAPEVAKQVDMDVDVVKLIFDQIVSKGLVKTELISSAGSCLVTLKAEFFDFIRHGSFTGQEELLEANINKLLFEIETLKKDLSPNLLEKANKIASIGASIATALGLFIK